MATTDNNYSTILHISDLIKRGITISEGAPSAASGAAAAAAPTTTTSPPTVHDVVAYLTQRQQQQQRPPDDAEGERNSNKTSSKKNDAEGSDDDEEPSTTGAAAATANDDDDDIDPVNKIPLIDSPDADGRTAFHWALSLKQFQLARELLQLSNISINSSSNSNSNSAEQTAREVPSPPPPPAPASPSSSSTAAPHAVQLPSANPNTIDADGSSTLSTALSVRAPRDLVDTILKVAVEEEQTLVGAAAAATATTTPTPAPAAGASSSPSAALSSTPHQRQVPRVALPSSSAVGLGSDGSTTRSTGSSSGGGGGGDTRTIPLPGYVGTLSFNTYDALGNAPIHYVSSYGSSSGSTSSGALDILPVLLRTVPPEAALLTPMFNSNTFTNPSSTATGSSSSSSASSSSPSSTPSATRGQGASSAATTTTTTTTTTILPYINITASTRRKQTLLHRVAQRSGSLGTVSLDLTELLIRWAKKQSTSSTTSSTGPTTTTTTTTTSTPNTYKAFINAKDSVGNTALHYASIENNQDLGQLLLRNGADRDIRNNDGLQFWKL